MIYWEEIWQGRWESEKAMWDDLRIKQHMGITRIGEILGVSNVTCGHRLARLGYPSWPPGGRNHTGMQPGKAVHAITHDDVSKLTKGQISLKYGISYNHARRILSEHKVAHKRG